MTDVKGLLQIAAVTISSKGKTESVLALCDGGCTHSWISEDLSNNLGLTGTPVQLTLSGINSESLISTTKVNVSVSSNTDDPPFSFDVSPYVKGSIDVGKDVINVPNLQAQFPHLAPVPPIVYSYSDVKAIFGQDVFHAIQPLEFFHAVTPNSPWAVRLPIGWVLSGPLPSSSSFTSTSFKSNAEDVQLAEQVKSWYDMESFGAYVQADPRSASDKRANKILETTTIHDGERYSVGMLWVEDDVALPNNYYSSLVQLKSLEKRLAKDESLKERYAATIKEDLDKGYVIKTPSSVSNYRSLREWYLPHHPVLNPNKPGKVRRVLNGAAKFHGKSLNSCLLTGPDLLQDLFNVLLRFRQHTYAVSADIEGMFLQVRVLLVD